MSDLPEDLHDEISLLSERGDHFAEAGEYRAAIRNYQEAYEMLPEPREDWEAATWLHAAIADAHFFCGEFAEAREAMQRATLAPDGEGNPFVHLRIGQASLELGDEDRAATELTRAYAVAGKEIFEEDDPKYWAWFQQREKSA